MLVTLLPFLLAANLSSVNESDWKFGPEVIYDARVHSTAHNPIVNTITMDITMKLKCRPKSDTTLSCQFDKPKTVISKRIGDPRESVGDDLAKWPFELRFYEKGLKDIVVPSAIHPATLDMIRALVNQLNVGTDASFLSAEHAEFDENEQSAAAGLCNTHYIVTKNKQLHELDVQNKKNNNYQMILIGPASASGRNDQKSTAVSMKEIKRTRNVNKCSDPIEYFFGNRELQREKPRSIDTKLKSSKSDMVITDKNFTSSTENTLTIIETSKGVSTMMTEKISLSLDEIVPASVPLTTIDKPAKPARIFPGLWINDESSEEKV